uniref:Lipocalin/cytosolic fatty-acid binding domain-containing protein n=2 Tax=Clastoptera arizonana TaxID=38151 RepID=A0A1B6D5U3_9HEMI
MSENRYGEVVKRTSVLDGNIQVNINDNDIETIRIYYNRDQGRFYNNGIRNHFYVIDSDYTNYAIIAACSYTSDSITILTRTKSIPETKDKANVNNKISEALEKYGLHQCDFKFVSNECSSNY